MLRGVIYIALIATIVCVDFSIDLTSQTKPFPHYWEQCVGSGHAALALRADYQKQLKLAHDELGFKYVRFHGLLHDDMSTVRRPLDFGKWKYSFFNIDSIFDYFLSIGMKPLIELSFMPQALASAQHTVFHWQGNITPPKNDTEWSLLIKTLVQHLVDRYGIEEVAQWPIEVWNEPNLRYTFWTGTQQDYFHLYNITAHAIKSVSPRIRVGGPATAGSQWIPEFVKFTKQNNVPVDFVSTHEYPTDAPPDERNQLQKVTTQTKINAAGLPVYYTEWNCGLGDYGQGTLLYQDSSYAAPCIVSNLARVQGNVDMFSYWTFSDIFEEQGISSTPHHAAFGMMTIYGTRKAAWRAFELLHKAGDQAFTVTGSDPTTDVLATKGGNQIMIFASNYDVLNKTVTDKTLRIKVHGNVPVSGAKLYRVDRENANAYESWVAMGSPEYPTKQQLAELDTKSQLVANPIDYEKVDVDNYAFNLVVPAYGLAVIAYDI